MMNRKKMGKKRRKTKWRTVLLIIILIMRPLSDTSHYLDGDHMPSSSEPSDSGKDSQQVYTKSSLEKKLQSNTEEDRDCGTDDTSDDEVPSSSEVGPVQESHISGSVEVLSVTSSKSTQESDEETHDMTTETSPSRPPDKGKRTQTTGSSKEKRSKANSEPVPDSDEETHDMTSETSPSRPPDKGKRTQTTGVEPQLLSQRTSHRRPWSSKEREAVWRQLGLYITLQRVPGKEECVKAVDAEPVLCRRDWRDVKNQVYNAITTRKRKQISS
uniref:uncharacterized protein isoform X1 n=2 Tax=Semicossyphus pulcher TaxID=241346 RepID=UPI0037E9B845